MKATEVLREVYELRRELSDIRRQLKSGPQQIAHGEKKVKAAEAALAARREEHRDMRKLLDKKELDVKSNEEKIRHAESRRNQTKSSKEFDAIAREIENYRAANEKLDEESFELMDEMEAKETEIAAAEASLEEERDKLAKLTEVVDYKKEKLSGRVGDVEEALAAKEKQLGTAKAEYEDTVKKKGDEGLAHCEGGACTACFTTQPPQVTSKIKGGTPQRCPNCGVLLF